MGHSFALGRLALDSMRLKYRTVRNQEQVEILPHKRAQRTESKSEDAKTCRPQDSKERLKDWGETFWDILCLSPCPHYLRRQDSHPHPIPVAKPIKIQNHPMRGMFCQKMAKVPFMKNIIAASPNAKTTIPVLSGLESFFIFGSALSLPERVIQWQFSCRLLGDVEVALLYT